MLLHQLPTRLPVDPPACLRCPPSPGGYLLPGYPKHSFYWLGLFTNNWPVFSWIDVAVPALTPTAYNNWGRTDSGAREPFQVS